MLKTIKSKMLALSVAVPLAIGGVVGAWWFSFNQLKVNGPVYSQIVLAKDLVADILPPPEYIIESYLVASQAFSGEASDVASYRTQMEKLKDDYDVRHKYWTEAQLTPDIAEGLLRKSYTPAIRFYDIALGRFFPALSTGDRAAAEASFKELSTLYAAHRAAIDDVVTMSDKLGKDTEANAASSESLYKTLVVVLSLLVSVASLIGGVLFSNVIAHPLQRLVDTVRQLAAGNAELTVPETQRPDELGPLAQALEQWRRSLIVAREQERREREEVQNRQQRQQRIESATAKFDTVMISMLGRIKSAIEHLHVSANTLSANAEQTQRQSSSVSVATEQANASVQTVSAAGSELMSSIHEIGRQVQEAASTAKVAARDAAETNSKIDGLASAAQKIGEIVSMINSIASQTNLLALNATIESARAGEAGKGFAVVAHEVKNLAGQTSRATEDIAAQVASIQAETREAVQAIESISQTIDRINEMSTTIAGAVEEQGAATSEIARNVDHASQGTREVASNISDVAAAAAETGLMARQVFQSANELMSESDMLETEVHRFLDEVRNA